MTRVRYDREDLRLEIEGHAGAGPRGADPVCAALSMLMMALERRALERREERLPAVRRGEGYFALRCCPAAEEEALCRESFDTVAAGFALLAENRPEHVSFSLEGEDAEEEAF